MGKFAGFLKRVKKVGGFGLDLLNKVNNVYKGISPFVGDVLEAVPFGRSIKKGLDIGSKIADKLTPLSKQLLNDDEQKESKKLSNKFENYLGKGIGYGLNKFLDSQEYKPTKLEGIFGDTLN